MLVADRRENKFSIFERFVEELLIFLSFWGGGRGRWRHHKQSYINNKTEIDKTTTTSHTATMLTKKQFKLKLGGKSIYNK